LLSGGNGLRIGTSGTCRAVTIVHISHSHLRRQDLIRKTLRLSSDGRSSRLVIALRTTEIMIACWAIRGTITATAATSAPRHRRGDGRTGARTRPGKGHPATGGGDQHVDVPFAIPSSPILRLQPLLHVGVARRPFPQHSSTVRQTVQVAGPSELPTLELSVPHCLGKYGFWRR
jgi:hypothetical protein